MALLSKLNKESTFRNTIGINTHISKLWNEFIQQLHRRI